MTYDLDHDHEKRRRDGTTISSGDGPAPGKRALTDRLTPRSAEAGAGGPVSLRGRERNVASFDMVGEYQEPRATVGGPPREVRSSGAGGDYQESRATIDGPARDPLDFLDREAKRGAEGGGGGHARHGGHGHGQGHGHGHAAHGGATGGGGPGAKPKKLIGAITSRAPLEEGEGGGGLKTRVVAGIGASHGVTEDATFGLWLDGRPYGGTGLVALERQAITTVLATKLPEDRIPHDAKVLATVPAARAPELHPDGSIGADDPSRLEA